MKTGLVSDPLCSLHDPGPGHPERPERLDAVLAGAEGLPLVSIEARDATFDELAAAHDPAYVRGLEERTRGRAVRLDPDTATSEHSWDAAVRAAGAALALGEAWLDGRIEAGFAAVRPPGHHACRARAMGFCLLNNVAVLARFLQARGRRVAIVDWDVHHGNGTEDIFRDDAQVGYASLHQYPLYPGTGSADDGDGAHVLNLPLPPGSGDEEYRWVWEDRLLPWLAERDPEVVLLSAGFDAHRLEHLASQTLETDTFAWFTRTLAGRPVLAVLEGGYNLEALRDGVRVVLEELLAAPAP
jgi:acetoin utilization deacetylase AcuC-like enzyme